MNDLITYLFTFGISLLAGFLIGYGIRKVIKILLVIAGMIVLFAIVLQGMGWIQMDFAKIGDDALVFAQNANLDQANTFVNNFSPLVIIGVVIGGIVGFVKAG
jgi:uncharacterized membrane protein (Fun14 family)